MQSVQRIVLKKGMKLFLLRFLPTSRRLRYGLIFGFLFVLALTQCASFLIRLILMAYLGSLGLKGAEIKRLTLCLKKLELNDVKIPLLTPLKGMSSMGYVQLKKASVYFSWKSLREKKPSLVKIEGLALPLDLRSSAPSSSISPYFFKKTHESLSFVDTSSFFPVMILTSNISLRSPVGNYELTFSGDYDYHAEKKKHVGLIVLKGKNSDLKGQILFELEGNSTFSVDVKLHALPVKGQGVNIYCSILQLQATRFPVSKDKLFVFSAAVKGAEIEPLTGMFSGGGLSPLDITFQGESDLDKLTYQGKLILSPEKKEIADIKGHTLLETGEGEASLNFSCPLEKLVTGQEAVFADFGKIESLSGEIMGKGKLKWFPEEIRPKKEGVVSLKAHLKSAKISLKNLKASLTFSDSFQLLAAEKTSAKVPGKLEGREGAKRSNLPPWGEVKATVSESLIAGIPLQQINLNMAFSESFESVLIRSFSCKAFEGTLHSPWIKLTSKGWESLVHFKQVQIKSLLKYFEAPNLAGEGKLDGEMTVVLSKEGTRLLKAKFHGTQGTIKYTPPQLEESLETKGGNMALEVGRDLHFSALDIILKEVGKELEAKVYIAGFNPKVMSGYPFEFNINVTGQLNGLAKDVLKNFHLSPEFYQKNQKKVQPNH